MNLRSLLYRSGRVLGDVNAVKRGRVARRVARRTIGRATGHLIRKVLR